MRKPPGSRRAPCRRIERGAAVRSTDAVVVEEPLELRVDGEAVATIMRTPGSDRRLAAGFFFTEGWIGGPEDVGSIALCGTRESGDRGNVAELIRAPGAPPPASWVKSRSLAAGSSCGVCGKRTIEDVLGAARVLTRRRGGRRATFAAQTLLRAPGKLLERQVLFAATGSLHAAGLFTPEGDLLALEEDVGRHNAVDKVIGWALLEGRLPLSAAGLQVSGRVSFEIVQKAVRAGIPLVSAVSGVSSLAVDFARRAGMTLVGFVRGSSLTVYTHPERVIAS
jgi:FdhD protein